MSFKQLSPAESLQLRKKRLEDQAKSLSDVLESKFDYLQGNFITLLGGSIVDSVVSKMPPFARNFIRKQENNNSGKSEILSILNGLAIGVMEIAPFFLKGKKGLVISFLLKQVKNLFKEH
jgi:hypothetical protein